VNTRGWCERDAGTREVVNAKFHVLSLLAYSVQNNSPSHIHTHTHIHTRARAHTHTCTHMRALGGTEKRQKLSAKWWQSGERKLVKLKQNVQIWVSKSVRLKPIPGDHEDKILGQWKPPTEELDHLTMYLAALPSVRYRTDGVRVVATDGALRKVRGFRAMGAAAVEDGKGTIGCCRVRGPCSSTRAKLVGIWLAVTPPGQGGTLRLLGDSGNAMKRLNWFRRAGSRPPPHKVPDWDIIRAILVVLRLRRDRVILTKVSGHTGDLLHGLADGEAAQEIHWENAFFTVDGMERIEVCWGEEYSPLPSSVVKRWIVGAAERYWKLEGRATEAGRFLGTEDVGRALLGDVLRDVKDWMIRDCIRTITPTLLPTVVSKMQWGQARGGA
jgi:ribonuclease HI